MIDIDVHAYRCSSDAAMEPSTSIVHGMNTVLGLVNPVASSGSVSRYCIIHFDHLTYHCWRFLSRVSTLTRNIDIAILSVCPSIRLSVTFRYSVETT